MIHDRLDFWSGTTWGAIAATVLWTIHAHLAKRRRQLAELRGGARVYCSACGLPIIDAHELRDRPDGGVNAICIKPTRR